MKHFFSSWGALLLLALSPIAAISEDSRPVRLVPVPAVSVPAAAESMMLGAAWAGDRVVAVGDHGVVLLSDDRGVSYRQAKAVPLSSMLTAVSFADAQRGWAVGHWGAIVATADGGETWQIQRMASDTDRPLLAVHFFDAQNGVAVGLWSLVLTTDDGGKTWMERPLALAEGTKHADLNLLSLFADRKGSVYATSERGKLLRSDDRGLTWRSLDTGYRGSLWAGAVLNDGALLVGGQRGTLLSAPTPDGPWRRVQPEGMRSSVTGVATSGAHVIAVGVDGARVMSSNEGGSYELQTQSIGSSITAVLPSGGSGFFLLFSRQGPIPTNGAPRS